MQSLECSSPSKHNVALLLYGTVDAAIASTRTAERDPLLAQCFGNRSAVLYGMKKYTASPRTLNLHGDGVRSYPIKYVFRGSGGSLFLERGKSGCVCDNVHAPSVYTCSSTLLCQYLMICDCV